jgi:hypothetical protein
MKLDPSRRDLILTSLLTALPLGLSAASASPLDPSQTILTLRDGLAWKSNPSYPPRSVDMCPLFGDVNADGLYYTLVRWRPGYMSAPHSYSTDRLCVVVSGTCARTSILHRACPRLPEVSCAAWREPRTMTGWFAAGANRPSSRFAGWGPSIRS